MKMAFVTLCSFLLLVCVGRGVALDCYVCRGCVTVGPEDVATCPPQLTTPPPEPTTDDDAYFAEDIQVLSHVPLLNELEPEGAGARFVLDDSPLPGAGLVSRRLQQYSDDTRCVIAVYQEVNGTQNVVRDCATAQADNATLCSDAVREDFDGSILFCHVCQDDLCNAASKAAAAALAILVAVAITVL